MIKAGVENKTILNILLGGAGLFIIIFGIKASAPILVPIMLALIIGITVVPLVGWLQDRGAPIWLANLLTIAAVILVLGGLIVLITISVNNLIVSLPQYQERADGLLGSIQKSLGKTTLGQSGFKSILAKIDTGAIFIFIGSLLGSIVDAVSSLIIMLLVLLFFILGSSEMANMIEINYPANSTARMRIHHLSQDLRKYISISTWINFLVGLINTILLLFLGVDFAVLWGILSFLTGYIPSVGFWIALIPPFLLAFLQFGLGKALIVLVGYILINGSVQNFLQPKMMGVGLNLSIFTVTVSLFVWGGILGPLGVLLAVPMTVIAKELLLDVYPETRAISDLMSSAPLVEITNSDQ